MVAAASQDTSNRDSTSSVSTRPDRAALSHLLVSTAFLAVGGVLQFLALASLAFPSAVPGVLAYGTVQPMAMTAVMIGWLTIGLTAAIYYALPRLTGAPLWRPDIARIGLVIISVTTVLGIVVVPVGLGDGIAPLSLPWWLDIPLLLGLAIPTVVTIQTVRSRSESAVFVSLWFMMAGVFALPLIYLAGNLYNLSALGRELQSLTFTAGFTTLWVTMVGAGVAYFVVVRATDNPLANRQLAKVGFWSLAFAASWSGASQYAFTPTPDWLDAVAAVLALALVVGTIANVTAVAATVDRSWETVSEYPMVSAAVLSTGLAVVAALFASVGGFRSAAAMVGLTPYWDGINYLLLYGVGGLALAAFALQALPPMSGRAVPRDGVSRHIRLTAVGSLLTALLLIVAGVLQGTAWTAASFLGEFAATGDGWAETAGLPSVLVGLAVLTGFVTLLGQLAQASIVYRTITGGRVVAQEVLVERSEP